jgi:hypothetical protein
MKLYNMAKAVFFLGVVLLILSVSVPMPQHSQMRCSVAFAKGQKEGPPEHAKAHGYRAKHTYRYYPSAKAYYDVERRMYFYLEGNNWQVSASLPTNFALQLGNYVTIEMDSDKPYTQFDEHKGKYSSR